MEIKESFLDEVSGSLNELLKPYQREHKQRERKIDFIRQCLRAIDRDDFFSLSDFMHSKQAQDVLDTNDLQAIEPLFKQLDDYSSHKVDLYRVEFVNDFQSMADEIDLPLTIDFPRFSVLKGIEGEIDFSQRTTRINKKILKTVDPKRIISALQKMKKQYYERKFDAQQYVDALYNIYDSLLKELNFQAGESIPIQQFYLKFVLSLQTKAFFQSFEKAKFKEYSAEQFSIDLWCYFDSGIEGTSSDATISGKDFKLTPGRNSSLWLIDRDGEKRQTTGIAFL